MGVGALLLVSAIDKLGKGWMTNPEPMTQSIQQNLPKAEAFYKPFLEGTVLPNAMLFSQLITLGELGAGLSLLLGLLTRAGAITCMWLMLNYMLMKGTLFGQYLTGMTWSDRLYFLAGLAFTLTAAGLMWGLDGALGSVISRIPVVRWLAGYRAEPTTVHVDRPVPTSLDERRRTRKRGDTEPTVSDRLRAA